MEEEVTEIRPAVLVNVIDGNGNIVAGHIMEYEVADFLRLRVDPEIAQNCTVEVAEANTVSGEGEAA